MFTFEMLCFKRVLVVFLVSVCINSTITVIHAGNVKFYSLFLFYVHNDYLSVSA